MKAQQKFFMALKKALQQQGYDVYDNALPPEGTPYPFVYLAGTTDNPSDVKLQEAGMLTQIVQVWGRATQRGTISEMSDTVLQVARGIQTADYAYAVRMNETEQRILNDNTTKTPLMQGYTSLRVSYSRR